MLRGEKRKERGGRGRKREKVSSGAVIARAGARAHGTPWEPSADGDPGAQGAEKLDGPPCGHSMGNATPRIHYGDHAVSRICCGPL